MKFLKSKHFILICILLLAAGVLELVAWLNFDKLSQNPIKITQFLEISPVYNKNGSWIFGRIGIGYVRWLLILVDIISLSMIYFLTRFNQVMESFLGMKSRAFYAMDLAIAVFSYRLFTTIRGAYTLDYIHYIGKGIYDLPDLYIFAYIVGMFIWYIADMQVYYKFKKKKVAGMSFGQKLKWEIKISFLVLSTTVLPKAKWEQELSKWR